MHVEPPMPNRDLVRLIAWLLAVAGPLAMPLRAQDATTDALVPLVIELLGSNDRDVRALALEQVRNEAPGAEATQKFAALVPNLPVDAQVSLLQALADRGDVAAREAVLEGLDSSDPSVRVAATYALGSLGQLDDLPRLAEQLRGDSPRQQQAARDALVRLRGASVPSAIAAMMAESSGNLRVALIEILAERRAFEAMPQLLAAAVDRAAPVRMAAMRSLGELAGTDQLPGLLQGVLKAQPGAEREAAEKAVMFVSLRTERLTQRDDTLLEAMRSLGAAEQQQLLPTLGRVGGRSALAVVQKAIGSQEASQHAAGIRALANWPDASVAPHLIQLARDDGHPSHRTMALRALVRVAPLPDDRSDEERLELLRTAMSMCQHDRERDLVIQRARAIRIPATLRFIVTYLDQPALAHRACESIVELAHHRSLREPNKKEFDRALDRVIETSRDATILDRAQRYKNNQTWVRPEPGRSG
jgi:HEAT repeat protein